MIWFIIGSLVAVVMIVYAFCDTWNDFADKIFALIAAPIISFIISLLVFLLASTIISYFVEINYKVVSDTKIIALKDNQNINGKFYIIGGYIDEDLYYYYATETELGYKTEKIKADNAYIKYTDGETHVEKYNAEFANDTVNLFASPLCNSRYIIYCPEDTVTNEFSVDLE